MLDAVVEAVRHEEDHENPGPGRRGRRGLGSGRFPLALDGAAERVDEHRDGALQHVIFPEAADGDAGSVAHREGHRLHASGAVGVVCLDAQRMAAVRQLGRVQLEA